MTPRPSRLSSLLAGALLLAASSCSKDPDHPPSPAAVDPAEITSEIRKGQPLELVLTIDKQDIADDGSRVLAVHGKHKGEDVGLIVVLGPKWETVAPDPRSKFAFHTGTVAYRTVGAASDGLLRALDELFGTQLKPAGMRAETKFAGTSLQGDPADLAKGEVRIKLSFEVAQPERQAELYTNIDLSAHLLHICEKDAAYRKALVQALAKE